MVLDQFEAVGIVQFVTRQTGSPTAGILKP